MKAAELATYLNDHLAGSVAALDLLDHLASDALPDDADFFRKLRDEIAGGRPNSGAYCGRWDQARAACGRRPAGSPRR